MLVQAPPIPINRLETSLLMVARTAVCIACGFVGAGMLAVATSRDHIPVPWVVVMACAVIVLFLVSLWLGQREEALRVARTTRIFDFIRFDALTGLLSRTFFADEMRAMRQDGTLLIVDVDHFKSVNDCYGHYSGDAALMLIANSLSAVPFKSALVGRLGGEEFGIFLPGLNLLNGRGVAEAVRKAIELIDFTVDGSIIPLTVSIGVAQHRSENPIGTTFKSADQHLYAAKRAGRNCVMAATSTVRDMQNQLGLAA